MSSRSILQVFDQYQKSRLSFVQTVADIALRPQNNDSLVNAGILDLIKPLLTDPCPQIRQCSAIALGRLVQNNADIAEDLLHSNFLGILLHNISNSNKHQKKSVLFVLRSICKHSASCSEAVIKAGGLYSLVVCLEEFETSVKEAAAWGVGYIARHNRQLAQTCVDAGALPALMLCLQEPEVCLKQISTSAISDIAKHTEELAQSVVDAGIVPYLVKNLSNTDEKLKMQTFSALSSVAKHSTELSEVVVEAEVLPVALTHLGHPCSTVRRNAACLIRDIVKHTLELTQLVVNSGGIGAILEVLNQYQADDAQEKKCDGMVPCVTVLGFIAGHSDQLAMSVLGCKTILVLAQVLGESKHDALLAVSAWTVGQIGKHGPEHAQAVAAANIFPRLLELYGDDFASEDLRFKCKLALKQCLQKCLLVSALEPLLYDAPPNILKYVLGQYSKILPNDPKARRLFVTSGGLRKVQEIDTKPGTALMEYIMMINSCFPEEIVRYYSPGYPETLLDKVEQYSPQMMTVLRETNISSQDIQTDISDLADDDRSEDDLRRATVEA